MNAPVNTAEGSALALAPRQQFDLSPQTFDQALTFSNYLADSDLVPKDFKGKPANCLIAVQWGAELGLKPLQAMQNLAIINGRPSLWGDAVIALVRASPLCEYVMETDDGNTATCRVKRRGDPTEQVRTFGMDDAKAAGLLGKQGPWTQYPKRMRQMRARAFALRDVFPDVLRGLPVAEELMDAPPPAERHMGMAEVIQPAAAQAGPAPWPDDALDKRREKVADWQKAGKTADDVIAFLASKGALSDEQKARVRSWFEPAAPTFTYAQLADRLHHCADADTAALILDEGRALPADQQKELADIYTSKFQPQG